MTGFERFAEALAKTESSDSETAWGDPKEMKSEPGPAGSQIVHKTIGLQFMAAGRWQMHPAWYHDWADLKVPADASWDEVFRRALQVFWDGEWQAGRSAVQSAMIFHLGHHAFLEGKWDQAYADRFKGFWGA